MFVVGGDTAKILFCSENNGKLRNFHIGNSNEDGNYLVDLRADSRSDNSAPASVYIWGFTYFKIPIDLNEGAGGNYIYLYYTKTSNLNYAINQLTTMQSYDNFNSVPSGWTAFGLNFNGDWLNLNSNGYIIKLVGKRLYDNYAAYPIKDIMVVSYKYNTRYSQIGNYVVTGANLNGGKDYGNYIYLYVTR